MYEETAKESGTLETPEDAGTGSAGVVNRWLLEISLADSQEESWRKEACGALERYRNEKKKGNTFNILWANTEVIAPNVYNSKPRPDIRNRFIDRNPVAKAGAEALERSISFLMDDYDFDYNIELCVFDMLLPGRAISRVRFTPHIAQMPDGYESLVSVDLQCEHVQWDDFRRGPGKTWQQVNWIAYRHKLTRDEVAKKFPSMVKDIKFDYLCEGADSDKADENPDVFKRAIVWEIWDKSRREVIFIHPGFKTAPLLVETDKLKLRDFFDCPRPLMCIFNSDTLVPAVEYEMYKEQAKELDKITARINKLTDAIKYCGVYDSAIDELKRIQSLEDGQFVPSQTSGVAMQTGGLDKAIWTQPVEPIAKVLAGLYQQREQIKQSIYEIMGLADIMRGTSDPSETLGAQELKAQTGSVRMRRRQKEVQRFIRDIIRIKCEILAEHVPVEIIAIMTGLQIPTQQAKQMASMQLRGNPGDAQAKAVLAMPSWEDVGNLLKTDAMRRFNIDIETDSTISVDKSADRRDAAEIIEGIGGFLQNIGPAVQAGAISLESAKKIMVSIIRKAKLGREVEDVIEQDALNQQPQPQKPDPETEKIKAEAKMNADKLLFEQQAMQAKIAAGKEEVLAKISSSERIAAIEFSSKERIAAYEADRKHEQRISEIQIKASSDIEVEKIRSASAAKPSALVQVDTDGVLEKVAMNIENIAVQAANMNAQNNEILAAAVSNMAEAVRKMTDASQSTRTIVTPDGRKYTAIVQ